MKKKSRGNNLEARPITASRSQGIIEPLPSSKKIVISSSLETLIISETAEGKPERWRERVLAQYYPGIPAKSNRAKEIYYDIRFHLESLGDALYIAFGKPFPLSKFKSLDVLDLACGSAKDETEIMDHPNLCRALKVLGCNVVGVDKYYPQYNAEGKGIKEDWKFVKLDLVKPGALREAFPENSFDIINADYFICHRGSLAATSPSLARQLVPGRNSFVPSNKKYREFENMLFEQVLRLLKPEGVYKQEGGKVVLPYTYQDSSIIIV